MTCAKVYAIYEGWAHYTEEGHWDDLILLRIREKGGERFFK
jgi:hypothetical protein